ncbi:MAG: sugar phosphate isomerase/epimerase family protein [Solirubrobacteraceae bacterium]
MTAARAGRGRIALFSSCLPGWSAERVLATATELGFGAVEWGVGPGQAIEDPDRAEQLAERCRAQGVRTVGVSVQDPAVRLTASIQTTAAYLRMATTLGAGYVRLFAEPYRGGGVGAQQRRHRHALDRLIERAAGERVRVLVETSPDTLAASPELALALVAHQPAKLAGVLYDPGNMVIEGDLGVGLAVALLGRHLAHVHVKNIRWTRVGGAWQWRYATLDGGRVRWPEVIEWLGRLRYAGWYSLDHLSGRATVAALQLQSARLAELLSGDGGGR